MNSRDKAEDSAVCNTVKEFSRSENGSLGWIVVFSSFMIHVICGGVMYTFSIFTEQFLEEFKETKAKTSLVSSLMIGSYSFSGPVAGWFTKTYGCRITTIVGSLCSFFGLGISAFATNVLFLTFTAGICAGVGIGFMFLPSVVVVSFYFERHRALATGIAVAGTSIGNFILPPLIQWMIDLMGWRSAMLILAGIVLNCSIMGAFFRPLESRGFGKRKSNMDVSNSEDNSIHLPHFVLVKNAAFLIFMCSTLCTSFGVFVPYVFFENRAVHLHLGNANEISYLISILGISNMLGRVIFGFLSDRTPIKAIWLYTIGVTLSGLATAMSCLCTSYTLMALYAAFFGATSGAYIPLRPIILADLFGLERLTMTFGMALIFQGTATYTGSPVVGWLYDYFLSYNPGFLLSGAAIALSGLMLLFIPCAQKNRNPSIKQEELSPN